MGVNASVTDSDEYVRVGIHMEKLNYLFIYFNSLHFEVNCALKYFFENNSVLEGAH